MKGQKQEYAERDSELPFKGRNQELENGMKYLNESLYEKGPPSLIIYGETGIGKTRLKEEILKHIGEKKNVVIGGSSCIRGSGPILPILDLYKDMGIGTTLISGKIIEAGIIYGDGSGLEIKYFTRNNKDSIFHENKENIMSMTEVVTGFAKDMRGRDDGLYRWSDNISVELIPLKSYGSNEMPIADDGGRYSSYAEETVVEEEYIEVSADEEVSEDSGLGNLFVVYEGDRDSKMIEKIEKANKDFIAEYGDKLVGWNGDVSDFDGCEKIYERLFEDEGLDLSYFKEKRDELMYNVLKEVREKAEDNELILYFEDIHWADSTTLMLFEFLSRNIKDSRISLIGSYRTDEIAENSELSKVLNDISRGSFSSEIKLEGILKKDIKDIVLSKYALADVEEIFIDKLYDETSGNPLFIRETLSFLEDKGAIKRIETGFEFSSDFPSGIPRSIHDVVSYKLGNLEAKQQRILKYASVFGNVFDKEVLQELMNYDELDFLEEMEGLIGKGIIHEIPDSENFLSFDYTKTAEVLYSEMSDGLKKAIHKKAFSLIETKHPNDFVILAKHAVGARLNNEAVEYSIKAGENALKLFSADEALNHYENAYKFAFEDKQKIDPLKKLAKLSNIMGNWDASIKYYDDLISILADEREKNDTLRKKAHILMRSDTKEAQKMFEKNIETSKAIGDERGEGKGYRLLGETFYDESKYTEALKKYRQSFEIFKKIDDKLEIGRINLEIAKTLKELGKFDEALDIYEETFAILEENGDFRNLVKAYNNISSIYYEKKEPEKSFKSLVKGRDISKKYSFRRGIVYTTVGISENLADRGKILADKGDEKGSKKLFEEAEKEMNTGLRLSREMGETRVIAAAIKNFGILKRYTQKWEDSEKYFSEASEIYKDTPYYYAEVLESWGEMLLDKKDIAAENKINEANNIFEELKSDAHIKKCRKLLERCEKLKENKK
ncbi:MAG: hypothetical protein ISS95_01415 [Candidatus Aenigmarchaeota archaeon]|nr:hypothetical protein [Candidatus Aenigmarchaeota archaeon]